MVKQKLCVHAGVCVCVRGRRQWSSSALSQQHRDYLAKFPLANNNSPQVPIEARLCKDGRRPAQRSMRLRESKSLCMVTACHPRK